MTRARVPTTQRWWANRAPCCPIALVVIALLWPVGARSQRVPCQGDSDAAQIADALRRIERSVDPCLESAQVINVLATFEHCATTSYQICTSNQIDRNVFDRPLGTRGEALPRTITWNPELRSELDRGCDGVPGKPVLRDPTASLLHEIVHAVQDCMGLNPGEHELEAVRIENIYRRAAGLCQRSGYGDDPLPAQTVRICTAGDCPCSAPPEDPQARVVQKHVAPSRIPADGASSTATAASYGPLQPH